MRSQVLLPAIRKVCNDAIDILSRWHQKIQSFKLLRRAVAVDRLDNYDV
jgi:hypothetical protein